MAPDGKEPPPGAARKSGKLAKRGLVVGEGGSSSSSGGGGGTATVSTPAAPRSSSAGVIDLSSPSWDDDPFLEAAEQHPQNAAEPSGSRRKPKSNKMTTTTGGGGGGGGSTAGRRRPAAPLTSISALFGGGGGGNRANRAGSTTAPPSKPRAGTKRPRPPAPATGQSRVRLPPPPPLASASAARGGRENLRQNHHPPRHPLGGGGLGAREATAAGNREGSVARGGGGVEDQLWPDKHRPRDISCLAVHSKKVDEVRHWMTLALAARPGNEEACRVLALVGPPGSAKSTMVRLLAQDMDVELAEWQDTSGQGGPAYRPFADGPALAGERPRYELGSSYQSSIDSFEEFMKRSSYRALSVLAVKPSGKAGAGPGSRAGGSDGSGSGGASAGGGKRRRVVLIEELPEVYGEEKKARLRSLMAECARSSPSPVIICWSQASESASYQSRLEQVLSRETLRMPGVQITTCNPINATLLRQHLKGVLALEGVSDPKGTLVQSAITTCAGDIRHALLNLQMSVGGRGGSGLTAAAAAAAAVGRSNGGRGRAKRSGAASDASTAGGVGGRKKRGSGVAKPCAAGGATAGGTGQRDTFLTQFHALGKLLYAKRTPPDSAGCDRAGGRPTARGGDGGEGRGPLAFVPEDVLSQGGMELDWALAFLQYHCVDFYTDESELSQGLGYLSDADVFASRMFDSSRGYDGGGEQGVFPQRYAESIASRATAVSNRHPAKSRMRAFGAPKSFEMRRSRKEAAGALRRFVGDAWDASGGDADALWASSRHLKKAVDTDLLPTARLITGEWEAEAALRSLLQRFMEDRERQQEGEQQHRTRATGTDSAAAMHTTTTDGGRLSLPAGGAASASPPPSSKGAAAGGRGGRGAPTGVGVTSGVGRDGSKAAMLYAEGKDGEEEDVDEIGDF